MLRWTPNPKPHTPNPKPLTPPADQADQCDKGSFAAVTASLVNDVHSLLSSQTPLQIPAEASEAVRTLNPDSIVLVAHSFGGVAAVDMLAGKVLVDRKNLGKNPTSLVYPVQDIPAVIPSI